MAKSMRYASVLILLTMTLPACAPVYVPNTLSPPVLEEQGAVQISGHLSTSGVDLQAAAALTNHLGVLANVSLARQQDESANTAGDDDYHRHTFGEVGLGYFTTFRERGHFEVYAGVGRGRAEASDAYDFFGPSVVTATGRYNRFFVQPAVGVDLGTIHLYGAARLARVNFYAFETSRTTVTADQTAYFAEPALGLRVGRGVIRFSAEAGLSIPLTPSDEIGFDHQPGWASLGVQLRLNPLFR